jgi:CRP/FNR family transcriptional regulator
MTREEIGSYLGLKLETISRLFSRFQHDGMVHVQGRAIRILDPDKLRALSGHNEPPPNTVSGCAHSLDA